MTTIRLPKTDMQIYRAFKRHRADLRKNLASPRTVGGVGGFDGIEEKILLNKIKLLERVEEALDVLREDGEARAQEYVPPKAEDSAARLLAQALRSLREWERILSFEELSQALRPTNPQAAAKAHDVQLALEALRAALLSSTH